MLEGLSPKPNYRYCKIADVLGKLDKKDQEILNNALSDPSWSSKGLARELTKRGIPVSDTPILKHRRKECACVR